MHYSSNEVSFWQINAMIDFNNLRLAISHLFFFIWLGNCFLKALYVVNGLN